MFFGIDHSARLGDLAQHYHQHRRDNSGLSLIDFINMHYGADSDHQKHPNHNHHNLPSIGHSMPVLTPGIVCLSVTPLLVQFLVLADANFFRTADLYSFLAVFALINPPRK